MSRRPTPPELRDWIEIVVDDNGEDLLHYLQRRTLNPEDAADLLGKILLTLWEHAAKVPAVGEDARMWCFGVARNVLRNYRRRGVAQLALADTLRAELLERTPVDTPDVIIETKLRAQEVRDALYALDGRSRELLILVQWDGFSIAQAARVMGLNPSSARTRYSRAKQRLTAKLAHLGPPETGATHVPQPTRGV
ncbi:RNA polymerase sigma factor [Microbacterium sp. ZW CA_36]|uniref:RNA polymerase sigma factor n=1 Tax=Microbacterium sp. ZW CA_36 TaxID=3378078 RepID=UPI0038545A81